MVRLEKTLLDKLVNKNLLNKRDLGRPLKHNIMNKAGWGAAELLFRPQGTFQTFLSSLLNGALPYISWMTYQFHVERARTAGIRVEDIYEQKFFREPYIMWHVYAQNFHPWTMNERVRDVNFYRKPNTLFKGYAVPDWAQSHKRDGFDFDIYSRKAWDNAVQELHSEWTPMQFSGQRLDPNAIQWARHEQWGKGFSSRFFYNEVPNPQTYRHGGNFTSKNLHNFKFADQRWEDVFGFETETEEGRKHLSETVKKWKTMMPEVFEDVDPDAELEVTPFISQEPHFQRVWNHYRAFQFNARVEYLIEQGDIDREDLDRAKPFFDAQGLPSANMWSLAHRGLLGDVSQDPSWESFNKIMKWLGLDNVEINNSTAQPVEEQFWEQFDGIFELSEKEMNHHLNLFLSTDEQARIAALEETKRLA